MLRNMRVFVVVEPSTTQARSSIENPNGPIRCNWAPVLAASRIMLPVFGGISGSSRAR